MDHSPQKTCRARQPTYGVFGRKARAYPCANGREAYREQDIVCPERIDGDARMRQVQHQEEKAEHRQHHRKPPRRPGDPGGGAGAHPTDSPTLFPCTFRHDTTLQDELSKALRAPWEDDLMLKRTNLREHFYRVGRIGQGVATPPKRTGAPTERVSKNPGIMRENVPLDRFVSLLLSAITWERSRLPRAQRSTSSPASRSEATAPPLLGTRKRAERIHPG